MTKWGFFRIITFAFLIPLSSISQENYFDSIQQISKTTKVDTQKVRVLNILSEELWQIGHYKDAQALANEAFSLSVKNLSITEDQSKQIFLREKANACNNLAIINRFLGNYTDAIKNHFTALKIREEIGDKKGVARSYLGIGSIYNFMGKNSEALDYKFKSKKIYEEINDSLGMAKAYNHIAFIFYDLNKYDSVEKYNNKALIIFLNRVDIRGMADVYDLFGLTFMKTKDYDNAIENFNSCLKYRTILSSQNEIAESNIFLGLVHKEIKEYNNAYKYYKTALSVAKLIGSKEHQKNAYKGLYELDSIKENFVSAFENHKLYVSYRDSLVGQKTSETIAQLQVQFDNAKKEEIRNLKEKQNESKRVAEEKQQKIILYSVLAGLLFTVVLVILIYSGYKQKQTANTELAAKNRIVEKQKRVVEEKQKEIIDSIKYARRIQNSLLPTNKYIDKSLRRLKGN